VGHVVREDHYHDDPVKKVSTRYFDFHFLKTGVVLLVSIFFVQTTLSANLALNSNGKVEFGQAVSQTVACSGSQSLTVTPKTSFVNAANATGSFYLNSIAVSNIPTSCYGADFSLVGYGDSSSTPVSILSSSLKGVNVYNNYGSYSSSYGTTISGSGGSFVVTISNPVALSSSISKVVIQSSVRSTWKCDDGGVCTVGDSGPGGGRVFYVSAGFTCGPTRSLTCKYLEVAPPALGLASFDNDAAKTTARTWAQSPYQTTSVPNIGDSSTATGIGWGYFNTLAIIAQGNTNPVTSAAALAQSFSGGGRADWYLPSKEEIQTLCNWVISGGCFANTATLNVGVGASGFVAAQYWTSNEWTSGTALGPFFQQGGFQWGNYSKSTSALVRPIRAF